MKSIMFLFVALLVSTICFAQSNYSDSVTITTYYPAPYGVYRNMRLYPSDKPLKGVEPGVIYFNRTDGILYLYNASKGWVPLNGVVCGGQSNQGDLAESGPPGASNKVAAEAQIYVNGTNPDCPWGYRRLWRYWIPQTFTRSFCGDGSNEPVTCTTPGGWYEVLSVPWCRVKCNWQSASGSWSTYEIFQGTKWTTIICSGS